MAHTIHLRYFASIREALGTSSETLTTEAATIAQLRDELIARGQAYAEVLARGRAVRLALDQVKVVDEATALPQDAELAFFPPVTGG